MDSHEFQFDESVKRALEKWPNVPNCFGWISLNRRGQWLIKDELITHDRAIDFLSRNYAPDEHGRWFIQNGPQRVFCDLDIAPLIFSFNPNFTFSAHTGKKCHTLLGFIVDEQGNLLLNTNMGLGLLDDRDLTAFYHSVVDGGDVAAEAFDYNIVRQKNAAQESVVLSFDNTEVRVAAEKQDELEAIYGYTRTPQPLESEL